MTLHLIEKQRHIKLNLNPKLQQLEKAYTNLNPGPISTKEWERDKNLRERLKGLH